MIWLYHSGHMSKEIKVSMQWGHPHTHIHCSTTHNSHLGDQRRCPSTTNGYKIRHMDTQWSFIQPEERNYVVCRKWMKLEIITLSKIRQTQKDKDCMLSFVCMCWVYVCACACAHACVCVYVCVCVCEREREREEDRESETERETKKRRPL
jgi:hypothetical protein